MSTARGLTSSARERHSLRAATTVVFDSQRRTAAPLCRRMEIDGDGAARARLQLGGTSIDLEEVFGVRPYDPNSVDVHRTVTFIGHDDVLRRADRSHFQVTEVEAAGQD